MLILLVVLFALLADSGSPATSCLLRVDAIDASGSTRTGKIWTFITGEDR